MTEAEARVLLRDWPGVGSLEAWIAGRRWRTAPNGWIVTGELQGWQLRLDVICGGLRISASALGGSDPTLKADVINALWSALACEQSIEPNRNNRGGGFQEASIWL